MTSRRRVPIKDGDFDSYIKNTSNVLSVTGPPLGYVRLGLTQAEFDQWVAYKDDWALTYPLYTDLATRTKSITEQKNDIKDAFVEFSGVLLTRISASPNITINDRNTFNLPVRDTPSKRGKINDSPFGKLEPTAVATIRVRIRMTHDAKRSSIDPLADGVELRWGVLDNAGSAPKPVDPPNPNPDPYPNPNPTPTPVLPAQPPSNPEEAPFVLVSTKALFTLTLPSAASGKRMYAYVRWVNQSNPKNNGPWSTLMQTNVL